MNMNTEARDLSGVHPSVRGMNVMECARRSSREAGIAEERGHLTFFNASFDMPSISMRSLFRS